MSRIRVAVAAVWPVARRQRWWPTAVAALGGVALLGTELEAATSETILRLRISAVLLGASAAFLLEDPLASASAASPSSLRFRTALKVAVSVPIVVGCWAVLAHLADLGGISAAGTPFGGDLGVECAAMIAVAFAGTACAHRTWPGSNGVAGACGLLVLAAAAQALPPNWTLFVPDPADPRWSPSHSRWSLLLAGTLVGLVWATVDPVYPSRLSSRRRRPGAAARGF